MLVTLTERKSRLHRVRRVESKQAEVVADAIIDILTPYKACTHTITFDNSGESAVHKRVSEALGPTATLHTQIHLGSVDE